MYTKCLLYVLSPTDHLQEQEMRRPVLDPFSGRIYYILLPPSLQWCKTPWVVSSWNSWWEATLVPSTLGFPFNLFGISYLLLLYPPPPVLQSLVRGPGMGCWVPEVVRKSPNGSLTSIKSLQLLSMDNIVPIWRKLSITPLPWVLPSSLMVIPPSFSS